MPKKILCATDGSAHSEQAVAFAARLAKSTDAALIYLAVEPFALDRAGPWPLWADGEAAEKLELCDTDRGKDGRHNGEPD